jgi:hypothetical protein
MVGEVKKGRYVYYHCTGYKGKCPEPYTREEILEAKFTELMRGISFSKEVLAWVTLALRESHADQKKVHDDAAARLQREHRRAQERIDTMYLDKLDGRIDAEFFDRKAAEWRTEQARILSEIHAHGTANQNYIEGGIKLLELAQRAQVLFERQPASEKRRLLDFVLSNCTWKSGELTTQYRQPFDILAVAVASERRLTAGVMSIDAKTENWLRKSDSK